LVFIGFSAWFGKIKDVIPHLLTLFRDENAEKCRIASFRALIYNELMGLKPNRFSKPVRFLITSRNKSSHPYQNLEVVSE